MSLLVLAVIEFYGLLPPSSPHIGRDRVTAFPAGL